MRMMKTFYVFKSIDTGELIAMNPQTYDLAVQNHTCNLSYGGQTEKTARDRLKVLRDAKVIKARTASEAIEAVSI